MRNEDDADEHDELAPVRRCGYCRAPMIDQRRGAEFCDRRCKELAAAKRRRDQERVTELRAKYPLADQSLTELYERATPPHRADDDQGDDEYPDDGGYPNEADSGPSAWSDVYRLHEAEQNIRARYEPRMQPYLVQLKRNPGVRPAGLVALERERDDEIADIMRAHDLRAELDRARRNEPRRLNEAHERHLERAALQALAQDLPGGSRRYAPPQHAGRASGDIWRW